VLVRSIGRVKVANAVHFVKDSTQKFLKLFFSSQIHCELIDCI
jgi:hypothetical protein